MSVPPIMAGEKDHLKSAAVILNLPAKKMTPHMHSNHLITNILGLMAKHFNGDVQKATFHVAIQAQSKDLSFWPHSWIYGASPFSAPKSREVKECRIICCASGDQESNEAVSWVGTLHPYDQVRNFRESAPFVDLYVKRSIEASSAQGLHTFWSLVADGEGEAAVTLHALARKDLMQQMLKRLESMACDDWFTYSGLICSKVADVDVLQYLSGYHEGPRKLLRSFAPTIMPLGEELSLSADETEEKSSFMNPRFKREFFIKSHWLFEEFQNCLWTVGPSANMRLPIASFGQDLMIDFPMAWGQAASHELRQSVLVFAINQKEKTRYLGTLVVHNSQCPRDPGLIHNTKIIVPGHTWQGEEMLNLRLEIPNAQQKNKGTDSMGGQDIALEKGFGFTKLKFSPDLSGVPEFHPTIGQEYKLGIGGALHFLGTGFSYPELDVIWTEGPANGASHKASLYFAIDHLNPQEKSTLTLFMNVYDPKGQSQVFEVRLNGLPTSDISNAELKVNDTTVTNPISMRSTGEAQHRLAVDFRPVDLPNRNGLLDVTFTIYRPLSRKKECGIDDPRYIGLGFWALQLD
ncbi:MAG: hypothetical protein ACK5O7_00330 [Holosporales bacterium]